jgi:outer membrane protein assembly factor BamE (lipoprotein component of BamABCDE complex)
MRNLPAALIAILACLFGACATPGSALSKPDLSRISVGMSKDEVISRLGKPHEVAQQGQAEYFTYNFDHPFDGRPAIVESYYVRFDAGKVDSYGRKGDFDSTVDPMAERQVSKGTRTDACDVYVELRKLEELRSDGLLTQEEFQIQKKKVLAECG